MKPALKSIYSPDVQDAERFVPPDPERFGILFSFTAGPQGERGEDIFQVMVCTGAWLQGQAEQDGIMSLRHYILVPRYDYAAVLRFLESALSSIEAESWEDIASRISRLAHWEFEDYNDHGRG